MKARLLLCGAILVSACSAPGADFRSPGMGYETGNPLPATGSLGGTPTTRLVQTRFGNASVPRASDGSLTAGYGLIRELGMSTIREGWNWKNLQIGKGQYVSWMDYVDDKADALASMGLQVQAMVTDTPDWASSDPTYASKTGWDGASLGKYTVPAGLWKPIFSDGSDEYKPGASPNADNYFAVYMHDMVRRYRGKVRYWQIWNEPDYPSGDRVAGTRDAQGRIRYWAGSVQDYVRLLRVGHTLVRALDPDAKVTLGGLGYEAYFKAVLDLGGAAYFDVVDFHAYGSDKTTSNGVLNSSWGFLGRYHAMKRVLEDKGIAGKTFACSETGFTADNPSEQASYMTKLFAAAQAQGDIETVQWAVFTNPGHLNIGLVDQATLSKKTQGYHAYRIAVQQLAGTVPTGLVEGQGVQGYAFRRSDGKTLRVVWALESAAPLVLPGDAQMLDKYGVVKESAVRQVALSPDPVYLISDR